MAALRSPRGDGATDRAGDPATDRPGDPDADNVITLLQPGSFVRLQGHPDDLPPFQVIRCRGGRCWVRQQTWGRLVHLEVPHRQLVAEA